MHSSVVCVKFSKKEIKVRVEKKGLRLVHKRPAGRGCGSRSPVGPKLRRWRQARVNRFDEQAVGFTLGRLQELKLLTLFTKHFHVQVTMGFDPVFMDFDRQRPNEP